MKKSILTSIIAVAMCAGVYLTNGQQPTQNDLTLAGVEAVADIELPEVIIECDTDPTIKYARCWIPRYKNNDPRQGFDGCQFNGSPMSSCNGNALPYDYGQN